MFLKTTKFVLSTNAGRISYQYIHTPIQMTMYGISERRIHWFPVNICRDTVSESIPAMLKEQRDRPVLVSIITLLLNISVPALKNYRSLTVRRKQIKSSFLRKALYFNDNNLF